MTLNITKLSPIQYQITAEISKAFEKLCPDLELLGAIGSWGDTLPEEDVLALLQEWNDKNV